MSTVLPPDSTHANDTTGRATAVRGRRLGQRGLAAAATLLLAVSTPAATDREYFDELFSKLREEHDVPGLAAVLVQDDRVVFTAGYGWANTDEQRPIDPAQTVFPLGSLSKVITTIAVLQLVEQAAIDLDHDIRRYLDGIPVDQRFAAPVTTRHLLTHTDGFDVRWIMGGAGRAPQDVLPLRRLLADLPPRVMPPGEIYLYGDVGIAVAGHIVEQVSRQPFADYVEQCIFQPLGMSRSSFRPDRKYYARDRATGYDYDRTGVTRPAAVLYPHAVPASGLTAPVADLASLMRLLLRPAGASDDVLGPIGRAALLQQQFTHHPAIAGTSFGFYEFVHRGQRALVHGGLLPGFTAVMILLPEARVGLCVAANRFGLIEPLEHDFARHLLKRYAAPAPRTESPHFAADPATSAALAGSYRCDQYSRFSSDKLLVLAGLGADIEVVPEPDGALRFEPEGVRLRPIGPLLFEREDTGDRVLFRVDDAGRPTRILGSAQFMSYHPIRWTDDVPLQAAIGATLGGVVCLGGPAAMLLTQKSAAVRRAGRSRLLPALALTAALGWILFALGSLALVWQLDFARAAFGEPGILVWLRWLPVVCGVLGAIQLVFTARAWRQRTVSAPGALTYTASGLASLLLLPLLAQWRLVRLPAPAFELLAQCL